MAKIRDMDDEDDDEDADGDDSNQNNHHLKRKAAVHGAEHSVKSHMWNMLIPLYI